MQGESVYCLLHLFDRSFSPHHYVGFLASVVHSRLRPSVRLLRITHNSFTHNSFTHNSFTHNSFTQFFPHDFVTHNSSHATLRTTLSHNFVTHNSSHTTFSFVTHTTLHTASVALGDIHAHFAWPGWHLQHWAGSGGAVVSGEQRLLNLKPGDERGSSMACSLLLSRDLLSHVCSHLHRRPVVKTYFSFMFLERKTFSFTHIPSTCSTFAHNFFTRTAPSSTLTHNSFTHVT